MGTQAFTLGASRLGSVATLKGAVATVALDAIVNEIFTIPANYGDILLENIFADLNTLSGAYVAPAPAFDGFEFDIYDSTGSLIDVIGAERFVNYGTSSTRPFLCANVNPNMRILVRQTDRVHVSAPILAGAGVTAAMDVFVRGYRLRTT